MIRCLGLLVIVATESVGGLVEERVLVVVLVAREHVAGLLGVRLLRFGLGGGGGRLGVSRGQVSACEARSCDVDDGIELTSALPASMSLPCSRKVFWESGLRAAPASV